MKSIMEPLDEATSLIAAAAHDVDHPGKSSAFLTNSNNPLAILYNDVTVLESHHAALTFKLTLGKILEYHRKYQITPNIFSLLITF